jgi:arylsulfatase A-like enzyme
MTAKRNGRAPNVVLFISDQQRADTMPGLREAPVETPHLDWLAGQGTVFRNAFCASPLCAPARAALLSGLYPHATGLIANYEPYERRLPHDVRLVADYLRPQGYACAYSGKWHLGTGGDRRGFSDYVSRSGQHDVDGPEQNDFLRFCARAGVEARGAGYPAQIDPDDYDRRTKVGSWRLPLAWGLSTRDAQEAVHFLRQMDDESRPLLLTYSCFEPHSPQASPRPFSRMYAGREAEMPLPETRRDTAGPALMRRRPSGGLASVEELSDDDLRAIWAAYCGSISYVDHLVGTILQALIETDRFDNTLFIYTSDHGDMLGSHGLRGKGAVCYEEIVRIPFLVRPPGGLRAAHIVDQLVSHVDVVPTVVRWCGARLPDGLHGADIRDLVEGGETPVRDGVGIEYYARRFAREAAPLRAWRTRDWKYVESPAGGEELYHLEDDPHETHNLIDDPASVGACAALREALYAWLRAAGDPWPEIRAPEPLSDLMATPR